MSNRPNRDQLDEIAHRLIELSYLSLPIRVDGEAVPEGHRDKRYTPLWIGEEAGHRYWMSALYVRTVMAFESSHLLAQAGLDPDARAHLRIMFDHLVAFGWLGAEPVDARRAFQLARYGSGFRERMLMEIAEIDGAPDELVNDLALTLEMNEKVKPPPSIQTMCREVDAAWATHLSVFQQEGELFSSLFPRVYRGASGFLHVTSAGIDSVMTVDGTSFIIDRTTETIDRVLDIGIALLTLLLVMSTEAAPWLANAETLSEFENLGDLVGLSGYGP